MSVITFWSELRWGREYGWRPGPGQDNPYDLGYHIAQDIQGGAWLGPVPVLRPGVIVQTGRSSKIGGFVTVRADADGQYDTYCHLNTSSMPRKGLCVAAGDSLPKLARSAWIGAGHDYMGSASTGPHCHFVITRTLDGAYNLRRGDDVDPRPIIRAVLSGEASGGGSRPFDPEENDMYNNDPELRARLDQIVGFISDNFTGLTGKVAGEADQTRKHVDRRVNDLAGWTRDDAVATRHAIGALSTAGTDPKLIAAAIAPLIPRGVSAKDVADELAKRLVS